MKFLPTVFALILLFTGFSSCKNAPDSKESYLKEYKSFIEEIKENKHDYSEAEWKEKDKEFTKFSEEIYKKYKDDLGLFEQGRIAKYALVYGSTRGVKALNNALENGELEDAIEEITTIFDEDIKNDLDNAIDDLKEIWDEDLKDDLKERLEELKEALNDEEFNEKISKRIDEIKEVVNDKEVKDKIEDVSKELNELIEAIEEKLNK